MTATKGGTGERKRGKGRAAGQTSLYQRARKDRARLFASRWIANGGKGAEAARAAGYHGTAASLRVTASRLLHCADVRAASLPEPLMTEKKALVPSPGHPEELLKTSDRSGRV